MTYPEQLKDPRWVEKRIRILERDNHKCFYCGSDESNLEVHHEKYDGKAWEAPDEFLVSVCDSCHETEHLKLNPLERMLYTMIRKMLNRDIEKVKKLNKIVRNLHNIRG